MTAITFQGQRDITLLTDQKEAEQNQAAEYRRPQQQLVFNTRKGITLAQDKPPFLIVLATLAQDGVRPHRAAKLTGATCPGLLV